MINNIENGEPIDYGLINRLIDRVNQLDSAGNIIVSSYDYAKTDYNTTKDNIFVQSFRVTKNLTAATDYTSNLSDGTLSFKTPFSAPPIVTVTPSDHGAYFLPYVNNITSTGFKIGLMRVSKNWLAPPTSVTLNVIAIGPK